MKISQTFSALLGLLLTLLLSVGLVTGWIVDPNQDTEEIEQAKVSLTWEDALKTSPLDAYRRSSLWKKGEYSWCTGLFHNLQFASGYTMVNLVAKSPERLLKPINLSNTLTLEKNIQAILDFAEAGPEQMKYTAALLPSACGIYYEDVPHMPAVMDEPTCIRNLDLRIQNYRRYGTNPLQFVDMITPLEQQKDDKLYYATDTAMTGYGAFASYSTLIQSMGHTPYSLDYFNIEHVTQPFYGNLYHATGVKMRDKDYLEIYRFAPGNYIESVTAVENGELVQRDTLFDPSYLQTKEPLHAILGAPTSMLEITSNMNTAENLLILSDNQTDALIPFLALHYRKVMVVDLNHITEEQINTLDLSSYQHCLFLFNLSQTCLNNQINSKLPLFFSSEESKKPGG